MWNQWQCEYLTALRERHNHVRTSNWSLKVIRRSYCLLFVDSPSNRLFCNRDSTLCNMQFVSSEISKLLLLDVLIEVSATDLLACNPLGVATNSLGNRRVIVDLHFVYLRSCKFKYEDVCTSADGFF